MTISDESHWSMSRRWLLLFHWHTHLVSSGNAKTGSWAQLLLIGSDDCTRFLQLAGDPWSLASYQEPLQRDEIPSNSAKSCIFEGTTAIDRQRIKAESQGTAAQRSNLSISGRILPAVDWMRCAKMVSGDNSGEGSSFAAKLSPWCTGGGKLWKTSSQEHQAIGREWRFRFLNLNKHVKQLTPPNHQEIKV